MARENSHLIHTILLVLVERLVAGKQTEAHLVSLETYAAAAGARDSTACTVPLTAAEVLLPMWPPQLQLIVLQGKTAGAHPLVVAPPVHSSFSCGCLGKIFPQSAGGRQGAAILLSTLFSPPWRR